MNWVNFGGEPVHRSSQSSSGRSGRLPLVVVLAFGRVRSRPNRDRGLRTFGRPGCRVVSGIWVPESGVRSRSVARSGARIRHALCAGERAGESDSPGGSRLGIAWWGLDVVAGERVQGRHSPIRPVAGERVGGGGRGDARWGAGAPQRPRFLPHPGAPQERPSRCPRAGAGLGLHVRSGAPQLAPSRFLPSSALYGSGRGFLGRAPGASQEDSEAVFGGCGGSGVPGVPGRSTAWDSAGTASRLP